MALKQKSIALSNSYSHQNGRIMKHFTLFRMRVVLFAMALLVIGGFGLFGVPAVKAQELASDHHDWKVYTNTKYQYAICYPEDLLAPQGESDAGDGQTFLAKDGAKLIVFASLGLADIPLKQRVNSVISDLTGTSGKVTYKLVKPNWFVISGQKQQMVYYTKATYTRDHFKQFILTYNVGQSSVYDPVIKRLASGCFVNTRMK